MSAPLQLPALSVKVAEISSTGIGYTLGVGIGVMIVLSVMLDSRLGEPTVYRRGTNHESGDRTDSGS